MKKIFTLMLAVAVCAPVWAKPKFVGHRGSGQGLENSVESFTIGAKRGYEYLETDWKLTKDKQFVCSHDDDTKRLGGTLTLATSTLAELQAETLTQTRSGVIYTGRLCSAKEYLDVCREYNVRPVIELKWTTGINSNDQSNIPMLIEFIESQGFRNKCIILTSMKPCLEYIRKNYPDIELQFLTGQYWANHFDWCVQYGMDVDIQTGYFDKNTIDKFHDAGLDVNIWTANTNELYKKYGDWGVDFITTDNLDPASVPALDPQSAIRPNKTDYPETSATPRGWFVPELDTSVEWPAGLDASAVTRMVYGSASWYALAGQSVSRIDPATGNVAATLQVPCALADIACGSDGTLYGVSASGTQLYAWKGTEASLLWSDTETPAFDGCHSLAVSGPATSGYAYITTAPDAASPLQLVVVDLKTTGASHFATVPFASGVIPEQLGAYRIEVTPTARENIIVESAMLPTVEYRLERDGNPRLDIYATSSSAAHPAGGISFARRGLKAYALMPSGNYSAVFTDIDAGIAKAAPVADPLSPAVGASSALAATAIDAAANRLYVAVPGAALNSYILDNNPVAADPQDVTIKIERVWLNSESTSNAPENIDGTNAQQGTAAAGLFYINDCAKKLVYVFDHTGCIGSMPGGAGWGCCRDDAGNIIVRDDKLTADTHKFIVYPAGATPADTPEPIRFEAKVPLSGQTNFINASGNVLGDLGYIYLYPNKQTAVNIIRLDHGQVRNATASGEITMTGSTAGYIVPIDNNSENWIYNVRAYGFSEYSGGATTELIGGRGGTTAPDRNTTGGVARFVLRGNVLIAHNSGSNYKGGFTLRNFSKDKAVIQSFDPIGDKGYAAGGNYSTFNWLIPERIDNDSFYLYQYCPANGMGLYRVYVEGSGVEGITADNAEATVNIVRNGDIITMHGVPADAPLEIYNLAGILVIRSEANSADISALAPGAYLVKALTPAAPAAKLLK